MSSSRTKPHVPPYAGPSWLVAGAWLVGALVVQATIVHTLPLRNVVPSFVLVVVVWYAVRANVLRAAIYGVCAGLCEDVLAGQTGAAWTIATAATAIATSLLSRGFFADSLPVVVAVTIVATIVRALLFWTTMSLEGYPVGLGTTHAHQTLIEATLNAALMAVAMLVVRRWEMRSE